MTTNPTTTPVDRWENIEHAARDAYEAYGLYVGFKDYQQGKPVPTWSELPLQIRQAWQASVRRVLDKAFCIIAADMTSQIQEECNAARKSLGVEGD